MTPTFTVLSTVAVEIGPVYCVVAVEVAVVLGVVVAELVAVELPDVVAVELTDVVAVDVTVVLGVVMSHTSNDPSRYPPMARLINRERSPHDPPADTRNPPRLHWTVSGAASGKLCFWSMKFKPAATEPHEALLVKRNCGPTPATTPGADTHETDRRVGATVGGNDDGENVGAAVGLCVVGCPVGADEGPAVASVVGPAVGEIEGTDVGVDCLRFRLTDAEGATVGVALGIADGATVGPADGAAEGPAEGRDVGANVGRSVGTAGGAAVGFNPKLSRSPGSHASKIALSSVT